MNKEFKAQKEKKCTIDNIHPNWKNQELIEDLDRVSQQIFGVDYDSLGMVGKWEVEDKLKTERDGK
jgi:hypothetical protein